MKSADAPRKKTAPVDVARKALQGLPSLDPNYSLPLLGIDQRVDQLNLRPPTARHHVVRRNTEPFEFQILPWHEEEVAGPSLNCARAREQQIGEGIPYGSEAKFV